MTAAQHGYHDGNDFSTSRTVGRRRKADPLDHTYYVQGDGDTRRQVDPRVTPAADTPRWRATCDVCPWLGEWHTGWPDGARLAAVDGDKHRESSLGLPGWDHCPDCGARLPADALCPKHAQAYEDHVATQAQKDPWSA